MCECGIEIPIIYVLSLPTVLTLFHWNAWKMTRVKQNGNRRRAIVSQVQKIFAFILEERNISLGDSAWFKSYYYFFRKIAKAILKLAFAVFNIGKIYKNQPIVVFFISRYLFNFSACSKEIGMDKKVRVVAKGDEMLMSCHGWEHKIHVDGQPIPDDSTCVKCNHMGELKSPDDGKSVECRPCWFIHFFWKCWGGS